VTNDAVGSEPLVAQLGRIVGAAHVVVEPELLAGRVVDWTGRWRGSCALSVAPGTGAEVAAVLSACAGRHVVVQGGNTGLVGGGVPEGDDILLLTHRLTMIEPPDEVAMTVVAGAGVTLGGLQAHLAPYGLELAVDIASRDSATVGGMASTNAGGQRVLRDGAMRRQVLSVDAYDVSGRQVAVLHELIKDNTGYDLSALLVGSEGTLAVITRLLLRVVPKVPATAVVLIGLPDIASVGVVLSRVRRDHPALRAAELVSSVTLGLVSEHLGQPPPVSSAWVLLLQFAGSSSSIEAIAESVAQGLADAGDPDAPVLVADDPNGMRELWFWRDRVTDAIAQAGAASGSPVVKMDVSIPASGLERFAAGVVTDMEALGQRAFLFGHVGDGNLHVNLIGPPSHRAEDTVLRRVAAAGGSISAEHGIGRAKAPWFALARSETEREAMRAVKAAWDPEGRLGRAIWVSETPD
jgi:FAD/FMN-containing dehydrogenase